VSGGAGGLLLGRKAMFDAGVSSQGYFSSREYADKHGRPLPMIEFSEDVLPRGGGRGSQRLNNGICYRNSARSAP
jgi:hypothetical protein